MNSPERAPRPVFGPPLPYKLRHRGHALTDRGAAAPFPPRPAPPALSGFAMARLYASFQDRRDEHFPEGLSEAAFALLVDLFQYEWLGRRAGAALEAGMVLDRTDSASGGAELARANLVLLEQRNDTLPAIRLTPSGRVRLGTYFDAMASYISRI